MKRWSLIITITVSVHILKIINGFEQSDYNIVHDHITIEDVNQNIIKNPKIYFFIYNRTTNTKALNGSATFVIPSPIVNIFLTSSVYKFTSNEYRVFPIHYQFDLCKGFDANMFGIKSVTAYSNFKGCPCGSGFYYLKDYIIQQEKFPPNIPSGQYKITININFTNSYVARASWYGSVVQKQVKVGK